MDTFVYSFVSMEHRREIVKKAIESSGISVTQIAKRMKKSRQWLYNQFENPNLSLENVSAIGKIIQFDFTREIKSYNLNSEPYEKNISNNDSFWQEKYYNLLEEYSIILRKLNDLIEK